MPDPPPTLPQFARLRLAELEGEMASDLKATREQIRRNDELKAQNDIQLRANEALARELMTDKSQRMADTFSVPSGVASQIANAKAVEAAMAKAGVKPIPLPPLNMPPPGAPRPPPPPASAAPKMISPTPASEEAASNFRRALAEQPSLFEEAAAAEPEPAFSTAALDESVAKSSATSRAAAAYTEPGLGKNKRSSWGPEVVLMAAAAAVEAAVDFATTTFGARRGVWLPLSVSLSSIAESLTIWHASPTRFLRVRRGVTEAEGDERCRCADADSCCCCCAAEADRS